MTSISADVHKYGYSAKGASVILYRTRELRKFQYFVMSSWPGRTLCLTYDARHTFRSSHRGSMGCTENNWTRRLHEYGRGSHEYNT
ncbi:MAG: hypothetical protein MZV63_43610 [Marinilabiliales bacterium]|nr:hypothetical protein [Marinilabiliales bacterium]